MYMVPMRALLARRAEGVDGLKGMSQEPRRMRDSSPRYRRGRWPSTSAVGRNRSSQCTVTGGLLVESSHSDLDHASRSSSCFPLRSRTKTSRYANPRLLVESVRDGRHGVRVPASQPRLARAGSTPARSMRCTSSRTTAQHGDPT